TQHADPFVIEIECAARRVRNWRNHAKFAVNRNETQRHLCDLRSSLDRVGRAGIRFEKLEGAQGLRRQVMGCIHIFCWRKGSRFVFTMLVAEIAGSTAQASLRTAA